MSRKEYGAYFVLGTCLPIILFLISWVNDFDGAMAYDSHQYVTLAKNIVDHGIFSMGSIEGELAPDCFRTPGYPSLLAIFYALSAPLALVLILQILLAGLNTVLTVRLVALLFKNKWLMLIAGIFMAFDVTTAVASNQVMTEVLTTTLLLGGVNAILGQRFWVRTVLTGVLFAGAIMIRPGTILLLPFIACAPLIAKTGKWKESLLAAGVIGLLITPWIVRNQQQFGTPILADVGLSTALFYIGADTEAHAKQINKGQVVNAHKMRLRHDYDWTDLTVLKTARTDNKNAVWSAIKSAPMHAVSYYVKNLFYGLAKPSNADFDSVSGLGNWAGYVSITWQLILLAGCYLLIVLGFIKSPGMLLSHESTLLIGLILALLLPMGITEVTARFRTPIWPFLAILSVGIGHYHLSLLRDRIVALKHPKTPQNPDRSPE